MKILNFFFIGCSSLLLSSCFFDSRKVKGNGNMTSENRTAKQAANIKIRGDINVVLSVGETSIKIDADENLHEFIHTDEKDGWLIIENEDNVNLVSKNKITVYISTPTIEKISVTGSGDVKSAAKFNADDKITFSVTGSGNLSIPVHAPAVEVSIAGSGDVTIAGETRNVEVSIAGSGNFDGEELKAEDVEVSIAGSGDAKVFADVNLSAKIMGSGNIYYKGNGAVKTNVMGSGSVKKSN